MSTLISFSYRTAVAISFSRSNTGTLKEFRDDGRLIVMVPTPSSSTANSTTSSTSSVAGAMERPLSTTLVA
jgi:hypothetical protein